ALAVALLDRDDEVPRAPSRASHVVICDPLDTAEQTWVWRRALGSEVEISVRELRVGMGMAHESASIARARGVAGDAGSLRQVVEQLLSPASRRGIEVEHPTQDLASVVLPEAPRRGLTHALTLARMPQAFGERRGVKILLSGAPGTGKTFSARALAAELGRSLYRIDLATVVSKWLGETEKNLRHAFLAARAVGAVLLFDEGEALMGQRGDVARGSDRYANLEVAYLLQALEAHDGVVVVTTNARGKMDGAFMRRFDVVLELPRPDAAAREALWRRELGQAADGLAEGFLADIAHRVELTGGHIAAAARLAHAAAHADARPLAEEDVLEAIAFEHDKLGGSMSAARFREEAGKAGAKWRN
ncbi:MAG: ATP-binding protein, partial [Myxococcales bacterium]|nr:ATP-binding protein [Myxococcales bacterium]